MERPPALHLHSCCPNSSEKGNGLIGNTCTQPLLHVPLSLFPLLPPSLCLIFTLSLSLSPTHKNTSPTFICVPSCHVAFLKQRQITVSCSPASLSVSSGSCPADLLISIPILYVLLWEASLALPQVMASCYKFCY